MKKNLKLIICFLVLSLILGLKDVKALEVTSLNDFISALENEEVEEIKLGSNITITDEDISGSAISLPVNSVNRVLDLNGHVLSSIVTSISNNISINYLSNNKNFTVTDTGENGTIEFSSTVFLLNTESENNKFIIENGIFVNDVNTAKYFILNGGENNINVLVNNGTFYYRNNSPFNDGFTYTIKNMNVYGINQSNYVGFYNGNTGYVADLIPATSDIFLNGELYEEDRNETPARNVYFNAAEGNGIEIREHINVYTVTFNSNGGSEVVEQEIEEGNKVVKPTNPTNGELIFIGWFIDDTLTTEFDFETIISDNITLYAKWEEKLVSISSDFDSVNFGDVQLGFDSNVARIITITNTGNVPVTLSDVVPTSDGPFGIIVFDQTAVLEPSASVELTLIVGPSYTYADAIGNYEGTYSIIATEVNGEDQSIVEITGNVNITNIPPAIYTVTFNTNGGSEVENQLIEANSTASIPTAPIRDGYEFSGWYEDDTLTTEFDFGKPITADTTIYAKWTKYYTVTFVSDVLAAVDLPAQQIILQGQYVTFPNIPVNYGDYILDGYFLDEDYLIPFTGGAVNSDFSIYIKYRQIANLEEIEEINLIVTMPRVDDTTTTDKDEEHGWWLWDTQTNPLQIVVPAGSNYRLEDGGGEYNYMSWVKGFETNEDLMTPFVGTFEKKKQYYAEVYLETLDGYKFAEDCVIKVNDEVNGTILYLDETYNGMYMNAGLTITPQIVGGIDYKILDGANQTYEVSKEKDLVVRADGKAEDLQEIKIDSEKVDEKNYTIESGSTIVTIKSSYLKTLAAGNHTLTFVYDDGEVSTNFVVNTETSQNPQTGDNIYFYIIVFMISCLGITFNSLKLKKNN